MSLVPLYRKITRTIAISLVNEMTYKANFLLMIIAPAFVLLFINYNLWTAVYRYNKLDVLQGYTLEGMLQYQAWVLIVMLLAQSFKNWNLSEDIRYGRITAFLLYPFEFWQSQVAAFIAAQVLQFAVVILTLLFLRISGLLPVLQPGALAAGLLVCSAVAFLWFMLQYLCGLCAFWLEETWIFRAVLELAVFFFSGSVIPLEFFPPLYRAVLCFTPFPLMTSVPVQIFQGTFTGSIAWHFLLFTGWAGVIMLGVATLWRRGIKLYTAAGM